MRKVKIDPLFIDDANECFILGYNLAQLNIAAKMWGTKKFQLSEIITHTLLSSEQLQKFVEKHRS